MERQVTRAACGTLLTKQRGLLAFPELQVKMEPEKEKEEVDAFVVAEEAHHVGNEYGK